MTGPSGESPPAGAGGTALDALVAVLDLEQVELDIFRGHNPQARLQRVFGGQVAGQALVAAGRTVPPERAVHSLHAYFLRPGDPAVPIVYLVDRLRDGRSFTTRRVVAVQHGRPIFNLSASFHLAEEGVEHQSTMPSVPGPEELPTLDERVADLPGPVPLLLTGPRPIDLRYVEDPPWAARGAGPRPARQQVWLRADGTLPDDPLLHVCLMTYASDITLLDSVLLAHGLSWDTSVVTGASLDHAMWFHRPFRTDEWLLYDQESPSASGSLALGRGQLFDASGRLLVSVVQEGLFRPRAKLPR